MKRLYFILCVTLISQGFCFAQYGLYEDGLVKYQKADYDASIKLLSNFLSKGIRDKKLDVDAHYYLALSYYKTDKFKNAIEDFEEAILLDHSNKGNIYWFKAKCNDKLTQYDDAISDYSKAIRELGGDNQVKAKLFYERSQVYMKKGNLLLAYEDLEKGNAANPANGDIKKEMEKLSKQEEIASRGAKEKEVKTQEVKPGKKTEQKKEILVAKKEEPVPDNVVPVEKPVENNIQPQQTVQTVVNALPTLADQYKDEKRFALVIGNSHYPKEIGVLKNPVNDATDVANELRASNFEVELITDATYGQMRAAMLKFKERVDAGDRNKTVSLFYYAGHGLQHEDENYLVPVDASIEYEDDIARYCFAVQRMILSNMERSNSRMNIVILDACRNNPFPALTRSVGQQGLGEMKRARGSFIAYATAPGSVASDGSGRNGLYTQELLKAMRKPGLTIEQVFKEVRAGVLRLSGDKQNTWDSSNIVGDFFFKF
jgi:tetratricopeptide (TPR) repeat protein